MDKKGVPHRGNAKIKLSSLDDNFPKIVEFHDKRGKIILYLLVKTRGDKLRLEIIQYDALVAVNTWGTEKYKL